MPCYRQGLRIWAAVVGGAVIAREEFVLQIPEALDPAIAGPILCAGLTVYAPMKHWHLQEVFDTLASASSSDFRYVIDIETLRNHDTIGSGQVTTIPDRGALMG